MEAKEVLKILQKAKSNYEHFACLGIPHSIGMCYSINIAIPFNKYQFEMVCPMERFGLSCPEFHPLYLNASNPYVLKNPDSQNSYWWDLEDSQSRIRAFETLIELYTNKANNQNV